MGPGTRQPLTRAARVLDRPPQGLDQPLGGAQVVLVRRCHHLPVAEIDQLQQLRHHTPGPPDDQRVETHLEQRLALEADAWGVARLVVHHPDRTIRGDVDAVDEATQEQARVEQGLDIDLTLGGLEPAWVLEVEVAPQAVPARGQPGGRLQTCLQLCLGILGEHGSESGSASSTKSQASRTIPAARSGVRSAAGSSKRSSRTLCTTTPRIAPGDGCSGRPSIVRKRYISAQVLKSPALLGERDASTRSPSTGVPMRARGGAVSGLGSTTASSASWGTTTASSTRPTVGRRSDKVCAR